MKSWKVKYIADIVAHLKGYPFQLCSHIVKAINRKEAKEIFLQEIYFTNMKIKSISVVK